MSYCNVSDVSRILPENVQIGTSTIGTPSPNRGNQGSTRSNITPQEAEFYIKYAENYIDGRLGPIYVIPLRRIKTYETEALSNVSPGTNIKVLVNDSGAFERGDLIRIQDTNHMETATIVESSSLTTVTIDKVAGTYFSSDNTRLSVIKFPDPVPLITAQMAASLILDRLFVSQNSPDVSAYGKTQRNLARGQIENILSGEVLLIGQDMTGRRFIRVNLLDKFDSPAEVQKGQEKE